MFSVDYRRLRERFWAAQATWEQATELPAPVRERLLRGQAEIIGRVRRIRPDDTVQVTVPNPDRPDEPEIVQFSRWDDLMSEIELFWGAMHYVRLRDSHVGWHVGPLLLTFSWDEDSEPFGVWSARRPARVGIGAGTRSLMAQWRGAWWR
jgi:hypothetical protein